MAKARIQTPRSVFAILRSELGTRQDERTEMLWAEIFEMPGSDVPEMGQSGMMSEPAGRLRLASRIEASDASHGEGDAPNEGRGEEPRGGSVPDEPREQTRNSFVAVH
jgi:hypothetical protein